MAGTNAEAVRLACAGPRANSTSMSKARATSRRSQIAMVDYAVCVARRILVGVLLLLSSAAGAQTPVDGPDDPARRIAALEAEVARLRAELARFTAPRVAPDWGDSPVRLPRVPIERHRPLPTPGAAAPLSPLLAQSTWLQPVGPWTPALFAGPTLICATCAPCAVPAAPPSPGARP